MPLYDYECPVCNKTDERFLPMKHEEPVCCRSVMRRVYKPGNFLIKWHHPMWVNRMDDIHKAQEQKGEKLRFVHPSEVL